MAKTENFMNILHQQASGGDNARIRKDKAIMRVIGSWIEKRTPEYIQATNNGESDGGYLGEKAKRACLWLNRLSVWRSGTTKTVLISLLVVV